MSYGFDTNFDATKFFPEKLREDYELYPKVIEMLNYIVQNYAVKYEDVRLKYSGPYQVNTDVVKEVIRELGYEYINTVMDTITNFQFNSLLEFVSVINLLKGSRPGFELILKLLGFDSIISEWWEQSPKGEPQTYELTVIMNNTYVEDVNKTLESVKVFSKAYIFPQLSNVDFRFEFAFGKKNVVFFGFFKPLYSIKIMARA